MEDTSKANIVFNISGGNNQILPNAIKAEQNFYGVSVRILGHYEFGTLKNS